MNSGDKPFDKENFDNLSQVFADFCEKWSKSDPLKAIQEITMQGRYSIESACH